MLETTCVFDATRPVAIQLRGPDGVKTVRVRFPSDDEWAERQRRRKVIIKSLGRGIAVSHKGVGRTAVIDCAVFHTLCT